MVASTLFLLVFSCGPGDEDFFPRPLENGGVGGQKQKEEVYDFDCLTEEECAAFKTPPGKGVAPPPSGGDTPDGEVPLFHAVSRWFLGEKDPQGNRDPDAWKSYGFDLDGWSSTPRQGHHCRPAAGGKVTQMQVDGRDGIDNSFSQNIVLGLFSALVTNSSENFSSEVLAGGETMLFDLGNLGAAPSYNPAPARWLRVSGYGQSPPEDWSSFSWRPLLQDTARLLPGAYLTQNVWVSGEVKEVNYTLYFTGFPLKFPVKRARVSIDLSDRTRGINGQLGGIIPTEALVAQTKLIAGKFGSRFCGESASLEGILTAIRQASDILQDGTQDPTKECDGISMGVGFETRVTSLGSAVPEFFPKDTCAP